MTITKAGLFTARMGMENNPLHNRTILVVDDVPSARRSVTRLLEQAGFGTVIEVENGARALEAMLRAEVHLVISDWDMPEISGLELLKTMRSDEAWKAIPFIMITSTSGKNEVLDALQCGANDYCAKPVSGPTLAHKVVAALRRCETADDE